jgi:hypothetical protein
MATLGAELRSDFDADALPWLQAMVSQLHDEGLLYAQGPGDASGERDPARVRVRLP